MSTDLNEGAQDVAPEVLLAAVFELLGLLRSRLSQALREQDIGLSPMHMAVLKYCLKHPGSNQQMLAQALGRDKGQIARLIKEFEDQDLLTRAPDPADRRSYALHLTARARSLCEQFAVEEARLAAQAFASLDTEARRTLLAQFATVQASLRG
mgnify:CR=1 FL=1